MSRTACTIPTCSRAVFARGWCNAHWRRWRKTGDVQADVPVATRTPAAKRSCKRPGCDTPARASGLCRRHYDQQVNGTRPDGPRAAEFVAVFEDWGGLSRPRLHRQALLQLTDMLDNHTILTIAADWTFEHVPAVLPGEPAWLIARHPATTTATPAELASAARALADHARGVLPALAADVEQRLADAEAVIAA